MAHGSRAAVDACAITCQVRVTCHTPYAARAEYRTPPSVPRLLREVVFDSLHLRVSPRAS